MCCKAASDQPSGNHVSACKNSNQSPWATSAPRANCPPRPAGPAINVAPTSPANAAISSVDPPSEITNSRTRPAFRPSITRAKLSGKLAAALSVGIMIDIGARIVMSLCRSATGVFAPNTYMIAKNKGMHMNTLPPHSQDRHVIALSGPDRIKFLQGLVSNDVSKLGDTAIYAALLTPQGKFMVDFFVIPQGDTMLIDVAASEAPALLKRLTMYKMRSNVTLEMTDLIVSRGAGNTPKGTFADPRHAAMGWRAYDGRPSEDVDWDALRVQHCVPETGIELTPDTYLLEAGFERLNGVDFRKGCYVGQEITARMKHKTELRKGLTTVNIIGAAPIGTPLKTEDGKEAGTLFTQSGGKAIAHLRFDRAKGPMTAGDAQVTWDG